MCFRVVSPRLRSIMSASFCLRCSPGLLRCSPGLLRCSPGLRGALAAALTPSRPGASPAPPSVPGLRFFSAPKVEESTAEYEFVERLIPPSRVPAPPAHDGPAPSGWQAPPPSRPDLPYGVRRSRMHNVPVYTDTTHGNRHITVVRKVDGDIWALERDVRAFLKETTGRDPPTQVNEVTMTLKVKGHFDRELKDWLLNKGF